MSCPSLGYCKGAVSPDYNPFQEPWPAAGFLREGHISSLKRPSESFLAQMWWGSPWGSHCPNGGHNASALRPLFCLRPLSFYPGANEFFLVFFKKIILT